MVTQLLSRVIILIFGNLYPAYASFKAVKNKNAREFSRWMMYWIVFALFTVTETFADIFISWFPFYYEVKVVFVIWLLLPQFKGSSFVYRKFLHPYLVKNEQEIDTYIEKSKEVGSRALKNLGKNGIEVAHKTILQKNNLWRSVSAQYLDQISNSMQLDYTDIPESAENNPNHRSQSVSGSNLLRHRSTNHNQSDQVFDNDYFNEESGAPHERQPHNANPTGPVYRSTATATVQPPHTAAKQQHARPPRQPITKTHTSTTTASSASGRR